VISRGNGQKNPALRVSHLASSVVAEPSGVVREGIEGGVGGRKPSDLAHFASVQMLSPPSLHALSIASSKDFLFALLIAAPLALLASEYSCQAS
jgi:hypothetical protein